jgi:hypothetical protein
MSLVEVVTSMASIVVIACSPYDPDLGDQPFLCGTSDPRCPDGYVCIERVNDDKVCERAETAADAGGDGNLLCSRDAALEPNETIETATGAAIAADGVAPPIAAVICPDTERDTYRLDVATTGQNVRVEVTYQLDGHLDPLGHADRQQPRQATRRLRERRARHLLWPGPRRA